MQVSEHRGVTASGGFRDPCESAHIYVSPGLVVSNLTPWALHVLPSSPETGSQSTAIPAGSMQPLLDTWRGADVQQHALLVALTPSKAGSAPHSSTQGEQQTARAQKPAPSFVDSLATFLEEAAGVERKQHAAPNPTPGVHDTDGMQRSLQLFKGAGARTRFRLKVEQGQVTGLVNASWVNARIMELGTGLIRYFWFKESLYSIGASLIFVWHAGSSPDLQSAL